MTAVAEGGETLQFFEERDEVGRVAESAMLRIRAEGLVPTPDNYTVWFAYCSGQFPDLMLAIDALVRGGIRLDNQRCAELHQRHFGTERERVALRLASDRLSEVLNSAIRLLAEAGADVSRYSEVLNAARAGLTPTAKLDQLRELVQSVADETGRIALRNRQLQTKLGETAHSLEEAQRDLETVRRETLTDALTVIGNRKRFDQDLSDSIVESRINGEPLSLIILDIDWFKRFNDTFGHVAGDQVLKLVARTLTDNIPVRATAARYGGEEFGVILPGSPLTEAVSIADRIRQIVASRVIRKRTTGESMGTITISAGIAEYQSSDGPMALVQRADTLLYQAKAEGRNRVVFQT